MIRTPILLSRIPLRQNDLGYNYAGADVSQPAVVAAGKHHKASDAHQHRIHNDLLFRS